MRKSTPSLRAVLASIADPRHARGRRFAWSTLLLVLVTALLCHANSQQGIGRFVGRLKPEVRAALGVPRARGPSVSTLHRVLRQLDVPALERALSVWQQQVRRAWRHSTRRWVEGIAIDGKTLRGAKALGAANVHLVSACCQRRGVVLGQVAVPDTTNEVGAVPALLEQLLLAEETVTFDALFTQSTVAEQVVRQGGAYLMVVKGNQPTLLRACAEATTRPLVRPCRQLGATHTVQVGHGRIDQRTLTVALAPPDLGFPHAHQVLRLRRRRLLKRTGPVESDEVVYALTSLLPDQASPQELLALWQGHWTIENGVHRVRDVLFAEDANPTHLGSAPQALAALRNLALSLLRAWGIHALTAAREDFAANPPSLLRRLGLALPGL